MSGDKNSKMFARSWLLIISALVVVFFVAKPATCFAGPAKTIQSVSYAMYVPSDIDTDKKHALVVAFSPNGDYQGMLELWKGISEKYKWPVLAAKEFRNGSNMIPIFRNLVADMQKVFVDFPIDSSKIIATGLSGGGMGAHAFSFLYPKMVKAVVVNTGMISEYYTTDTNKYLYPKGKLAVFLASPTDFRYQEMKRDRYFLEELSWRINWIEFAGGHCFAPASTYEQAAEWLAKEL